ncbi:MAG: ABC transporter ATP-binding protein [Nocardioides sp.]
MAEAIVAQNVTKDFVLRRHKTFKQMSVAKMRGQETVNRFNAVDDVSFTIQEGESVGLMGLNGSGKSTLLKVISGVMKPNKGTILTRGRIAGLIATGAGFQSSLSGLDNIFLNAAIYGLNEKETKAVLDEIIDFADIGQFIDQPVGTYSSGMSSRLGFSIAVHVDCDIFLADEILAVGDKPFKRKCMTKMEEIRNSGKTIVYVSHAAASVQKMCDRVIALEKGRLLFDGDVDEGIRILDYGDEDGDELAADDAELGADV